MVYARGDENQDKVTSAEPDQVTFFTWHQLCVQSTHEDAVDQNPARLYQKFPEILNDRSLRVPGFPCLPTSKPVCTTGRDSRQHTARTWSLSS